MSEHDLAVIGGGAAGLGAAREAKRRGARVLLITDGEPGGDCTFTGCVPSKTLIAASRTGTAFTAAARRVHAAVEQVAAAESAAVLRGEGIDVRFGRATFTAPGRITVDGAPCRARRIVVATGSRPAIPPIPGLADIAYLTNESVFDLRTLPRSLLVLGGGAIGCELAQAFAGFGTQVSVIEADERLLPGEDPRAGTVVAAVFARAGIEVRTGVTAAAAAAHACGAQLTLTDGSIMHGEHLLIATGRRPRTAGLGLAAAGIGLDRRGAILVDENLQAAPHVYAAGDVTARAMLTHAADDMGRHCARNALRRRARPWRPPVIPRVVFTSPELAQAGATLADAPAGSRVAYLPMSEVDRAITEDATDGFVQLIAAPRTTTRNLGGGKLIGATILAPRAGEMLAEAALAIATGMFTGRVAATMHAYPTWSSAVQIAAAQFFTEIGGRRALPIEAVRANAGPRG